MTPGPSYPISSCHARCRDPRPAASLAVAGITGIRQPNPEVPDPETPSATGLRPFIGETAQELHRGSTAVARASCARSPGAGSAACRRAQRARRPGARVHRIVAVVGNLLKLRLVLPHPVDGHALQQLLIGVIAPLWARGNDHLGACYRGPGEWLGRSPSQVSTASTRRCSSGDSARSSLAKMLPTWVSMVRSVSQSRWRWRGWCGLRPSAPALHVPGR